MGGHRGSEDADFSENVIRLLFFFNKQLNGVAEEPARCTFQLSACLSAKRIGPEFVATKHCIVLVFEEQRPDSILAISFI